MTKKRRRNKPYRPKPVRPPMIVGAALVFGPIQAVIDQIERDGTVTTNRTGSAMFQDGDGSWYCTATAIQGVIDHCDMWCTRHSRALPLESLSEFQRLIKYTMPISASLMQRLQRDLPIVQAAMARGSPDDMVDLLTQVQIRDEMEKTQ